MRRFKAPRSRWMPAVLLALLFLAALAASSRAETPRPSGDRSRADAYLLAIGDTWTTTNISVDEMQRLHARVGGDFLWIRRAGQRYLVRDAATLGAAKGLFAALEPFEPEVEALRRKQSAVDERERALDAEEEALDRATARAEEAEQAAEEGKEEDTVEAPPAAEDTEERRRALAARRRDLETETRAVEAEERSLDSRQEAVEREAEQRLWELIDRLIASGAAAPADR